MAIFDYVMLLISVVLSLGLARLLETHARLIKRGAAVGCLVLCDLPAGIQLAMDP